MLGLTAKFAVHSKFIRSALLNAKGANRFSRAQNRYFQRARTSDCRSRPIKCICSTQMHFIGRERQSLVRALCKLKRAKISVFQLMQKSAFSLPEQPKERSLNSKFHLPCAIFKLSSLGAGGGSLVMCLLGAVGEVTPLPICLNLLESWSKGPPCCKRVGYTVFRGLHFGNSK